MRAPPRRLLVLALLVVAALGYAPVVAHLRAAGLLLRFAEQRAPLHLEGFGRRELDEKDLTLSNGSGGETRARLYTPVGGVGGAGVVLVHGVHRLGIDEPRLVRFARAVASSGVTVLTPEVKEIADYRIDPRSIDTIGAAAHELAARTGRPSGIMGMSFAGGLSLLAAASPTYAHDIGFVVAIGAHGSLARVSTFFATDREAHPDGHVQELKAHGYGALVMIYQRAESFFPPEDVGAARDALRLWLWDDRDGARARAEVLTPESWAKIDTLFAGEVEAASAAMLEVVEHDRAAMETVSPSGHLSGLRVPVFLLHGAGDTVIPSAETEWIASEVPPRSLREVLVSPALVHVELGPGTPASQKWDLVHFMARVLEEAS